MPVQKIKIASIGECMLEFHHRTKTHWELGYGGDTFNVAFYLNHYAEKHCFEIQYITALGDDAYSQEMLNAWNSKGIGTEWITRFAGSQPGLYLINTDASGERSFCYYRNESAARNMFTKENAQQLHSVLVEFNMLYFSGITLAILDPQSRNRLKMLLKSAKNRGASIVFDTNYRPKLWESQKTAQQVFLEFFPYVEIALPTFEDHQRLFGVENPESCAKHLHDLGVEEVIVKWGASPCWVSEKGHPAFWVAAQKIETVMDTSGAGDSFNAGYLLGKLHQCPPTQAAAMGHRLAATVVQHRGVILSPEFLPKLF